MTKLDDWSWHAGSEGFPPAAPAENGATHIGFFVAWIINNDYWADELLPYESEALEAVRHGRASGRQFLIDHCDGKLLTEMMIPDIAAFSSFYYDKQYLKDYGQTLVVGLSSGYLVEDTDANYNSIAMVISRRYEDGRMRANRPWWKFW